MNCELNIFFPYCFSSEPNCSFNCLEQAIIHRKNLQLIYEKLGQKISFKKIKREMTEAK